MMKRQGLVVFAGGPPRDSRPAFGSDGPLPVGVVFFPSFPFMGVMLFPSPMLGNAPGESGVLLVPLSPFSPLLPSLLPLSLLSSPFPSPFPLVHTLFSSLSLSLSLSWDFSYVEETTCTIYSRDVRDGTADCNQLYLHWNKGNFFFWRMNLCIMMCATFSYVPWLSCLFFFYRDALLFDL